MPRRSQRRRAAPRVLFVAIVTVLCLLAAVGGFVAGASEAVSRRPPVHTFYVRAGGIAQAVRLSGAQTVTSLLIMAGATNHDGRLLSIKRHAVLNPSYDPARLMVDGRVVAAATPVAIGATVDVVPGRDAVEGTRRLEIPVPPPPMPDALRHIYHRGRAGLMEEVVGLHSGELVSSRIVHAPVPPRPDTDRVVALTFDDGPQATWTPAMLAMLASKGVKATFCEIGTMVDYHPEVTKAVVAAGHQLCNHTLDHVEDLDKVGQAEVEHEIGGGADAQMALGLPAPQYYRPPGGTLSADVIATARAHHEQTIYWKVDTDDWKRDATIASIVGNLQHEVDPGAIILMHDGGGKTRGLSVIALGVIIDWLRSQGYGFTFPIVN